MTERTDLKNEESLGGVLWGMLADPRRHLLARWNWKAAVTSSFMRGAIFFAVNLTASVPAAWAAFFTEFAFRGVASGFFGAASQNFSRVRPAWKGTAAAMVVLPAVAHAMEYLVHAMAGTEKLNASIAASICFTAVSTWFHVYLMRQGLLTVDERRQSLWKDLILIPETLYRAFAGSGGAGEKR